MYNFETQQTAGTLVHVETAAGINVLTFAPAKSYQSVLLSSPDLTNGSMYVVYSGGNSTGSLMDGLYSDGTYAAGSQIADLTVSSIVTTAGAAGGGPGGPRP